MDAERSTWNIGAPAGWRQDTPRPRERAQYHPPRDLLAPSTVDRQLPHPLAAHRSCTGPPPDRLDTHARHRLLVRCEHTRRPRVALRRPGAFHWPGGTAGASDPAAVDPSRDDPGAASGVPRGTGEGAGGAQGACVPRGTRERPGDPGVLPWQSSGPTLPAPANDQQDRHREGGSRGRRTIALPTRPRCRAAESDDQPLGQPVLDRHPSSSPARAPVQPAPPPRRRAGVLLPGARPGVCPGSAAAPAARSVRGSRCFHGQLGVPCTTTTWAPGSLGGRAVPTERALSIESGQLLRIEPRRCLVDARGQSGGLFHVEQPFRRGSRPA